MSAVREGRIVVRVPNLFASFLQTEPVTNTNYEIVRSVSECFVNSECQLRGNIAQAVKKCDFSYFAAVMAPRADADTFRLICDWGNWIFPFDDLFDDGYLRAHHVEAQVIMNRLLCVFDHESAANLPVANPIVKFHDGIWRRIRSTALPGTANRYQAAMRDYCCGTLDQVGTAEARAIPALEEMLSMRRRSVCVATLFSLVEYGERINLPTSVFQEPVIQEIEMLAIDLILLHNDILSYRKEESEGVSHNMVATCRLRGHSAQGAVDTVAALIDDRHRRLRKAALKLPNLGAEVMNRELERYISGIRNVVSANLYWSFRSGRFLSSEQKADFRERFVLDVQRYPAYLGSRHHFGRGMSSNL